MEQKIEIMNLLQNKQILEHELQSLAYGSVEIRENNIRKNLEVDFVVNNGSKRYYIQSAYRIRQKN